MGEDGFIAILTGRPVFMIAGYLLGLLTGWVIWRLANQSASEKDASGVRVASVLSAINGETKTEPAEDSEHAPNGKHDAPDDLKLAALEAEIKEAKALLANDPVDYSAVNERLSEVDAAVKRTNGRLKLVLKSIQNEKDSA